VKAVDYIRGFEREIKFAPTGGDATGGGLPLTNCVIEVVENDWQGGGPMPSLRFYHKPTFSYQIAQESVEAGRPLYEEDTPIGVELSLGPEIARSLIEQLQEKWPEYVQTLNDEDRKDRP
jgi:hypothetical protein